MRFTFPFVRSLLFASIRTPPKPFASIARPALPLKSMPTIPFLGALFSTAENRKMSHPVQKSDSEWQAQLSPGM